MQNRRKNEKNTKKIDKIGGLYYILDMEPVAYRGRVSERFRGTAEGAVLFYF